ncbi:MAG TPA: hypothetical protein VF017_19380 [Thermoanaerobaculia bacterium]|nr:hypothetical protein [Thermoanaerobaculia bacterium]
MRQTNRAFLVVLAAALALHCGGQGKRLAKPARSVLWVTSGTEPSFAELTNIEPFGISETFVEAGRLSWQGTAPSVAPLPLPSLASRRSVTLVLRGVWASGELDAAGTARALARSFEAMAGAARAKNLDAIGLHLDVDAGESLRSLATTAAELRKQLDPKVYLSATLSRRVLASEEAKALAKAVDFVVAFLYGRRPGESDDKAAWDLEKVEAGMKRLEELDRPYLLGVVTVGRAFHLDRGGQALAETTRLKLSDLAHNEALELASGFSLEGIDRVVYTFRAKVPTRVGDWRVEPQQGVRVVGLTTHYIEELERRLGALGLDHFLGTAYYRYVSPEEGLSMSLANLAQARSAEAPPIGLKVYREGEGGSASRPRFRVVVENPGDDRTDILFLGNNFVEVEVSGGTIAKVDPGAFRRYELLRRTEDGELERDYREARVLRLFTPMLDRRDRRESGAIEIVGKGAAPKIAIRASFVVPGGEVWEAVEEEPAPEGKPGG